MLSQPSTVASARAGAARAETAVSWPIAAPSMPSHIVAATAGMATTLAGSPDRETVSKWCASSGAVPIVAATVRATPSASGPGSDASDERNRPPMAMIEITAAKESCQPGSAVTRGLSARVTTAASSSAYHRDDGRAAPRATRPAAPMTPARWSDATGPGERHVHGDQHEHRRRPGPRSGSDRHQERDGQRAEQHDVLAAHGKDVCEPGAPEVLLVGLRDPLVLAEHHPASEGDVRGRQPGRYAALGSAPGAVDRAGQAAAPPPGQAQAFDSQLECDAAAPQVTRPVEVGVRLRLRPPQRARDAGPRARARRRAASERRGRCRPSPALPRRHRPRARAPRAPRTETAVEPRSVSPCPRSGPLDGWSGKSDRRLRAEPRRQRCRPRSGRRSASRAGARAPR